MIEQRTDEWHMQRLGKITASRIGDVMARTKSGYGAARKNYMAELLVERVTGTWTQGFISKEMQWGTDQEPHARTEYEMETGNVVVESGFVQHPEMWFTGGSPDGFVSDDGLIEIKCPNTATHLGYILGNAIDRRYQLQMQWCMECAQLGWCDFVAYDPRVQAPVPRLWVVRYDRDNELIGEITAEVRKFEAELEAMERQLRERV
jgi:putative phage-type endonuclease